MVEILRGGLYWTRLTYVPCVPVEVVLAVTVVILFNLLTTTTTDDDCLPEFIGVKLSGIFVLRHEFGMTA